MKDGDRGTDEHLVSIEYNQEIDILGYAPIFEVGDVLRAVPRGISSLLGYCANQFSITYQHGILPLKGQDTDRIWKSREYIAKAKRSERIWIDEIKKFIQADPTSDLTFNTMRNVVPTLSDVDKKTVLDEWVKGFVSANRDIDPKVSNLLEWELYCLNAADVMGYLLKHADLSKDANIKLCDELIKKDRQIILHGAVDILVLKLKDNKFITKISIDKIFNAQCYDVLGLILKAYGELDVEKLLELMHSGYGEKSIFQAMSKIFIGLNDEHKQTVLKEWLKLLMPANGDIHPSIMLLLDHGLYEDNGTALFLYILQHANFANIDNVEFCEKWISARNAFIYQIADEISEAINANESIKDVKITDLYINNHHEMMYIFLENCNVNPKALKPVNKKSPDIRLKNRLGEVAGLDHDVKLLKVLQDKDLAEELGNIDQQNNYFTLALLNTKKEDEETLRFIESIIPDQLNVALQFVNSDLFIEMLKCKKITSINVLFAKLSDNQKASLFSGDLDETKSKEIALHIAAIVEDFVQPSSTKQHVATVLNLLHFLPAEYLADFNIMIALKDRADFIEVIDQITGIKELCDRFITHNHMISAFKELIEANNQHSRKILSLALNVNIKMEEFRSLLEYSIAHNSYDSVKTLIKFWQVSPQLGDACLKVCDDKGRDVIKALLVSSMPENKKNKLIEQCIFNEDKSLKHDLLKPQHDFKPNLLMLAFLTGNQQFIDTLCADLEFVKSSFINAPDHEGYSICHYMVLSKFEVEYVLKKFRDFNITHREINSANKQGVTPLMLALLNNNMDMFRLLLNLGADINAKDNNGFNVLSYACYHGKEDFIDEILANREADLNATNKHGLNAIALLHSKDSIPVTNDIRNTIEYINSYLSDISVQLYKSVCASGKDQAITHRQYGLLRKKLVNHGVVCDMGYKDVYIVRDLINLFPKLVFKGARSLYENVHGISYVVAFVIACLQPLSWMSIVYHGLGMAWLLNIFMPTSWEAIKDYLDDFFNLESRFDFDKNVDHLVGLYAIGPFGHMISGNALRDHLSKEVRDKEKHRVISKQLDECLVADVSGLKGDPKFKTFSNYEKLISRYCQLHNDYKRMPFLARIQSLTLKSEISEACAHICNDYNGANAQFNQKFQSFQALMLGYNARVVHRELKDNVKFNKFIKDVIRNKVLVSPELYVACLEYNKFRLQYPGMAWIGARTKDYFSSPNVKAVVDEIEQNANEFYRSQQFSNERSNIISRDFDVEEKPAVKVDADLEQNRYMSKRTKSILGGSIASAVGVGCYYVVYNNQDVLLSLISYGVSIEYIELAKTYLTTHELASNAISFVAENSQECLIVCGCIVVLTSFATGYKVSCYLSANDAVDNSIAV